ncbi:MAG: M28 family peptidase [Bacteroidales bacterium]|nr:M28 family peptidase [Bacteroidales bacterium]
MKRFLTILLIACSFHTFAQLESGRKYLNDLCSERMHGRGYVNNGIQNAEKYIQQKFESFQLQNLFDEEGSSVTYSVNTFPDKLQLTIDGTQLTAGKDFMIDAISGGGTATLKCIPFNKKDLQDVCTGNNISALKEKYKSKYAQTCLIFDETDTTLTSKQKEIINDWITLDLVYSDIYNIGAIVKITNQKLTQNIAGVCGNVPYFIVSDKSLKSKNIKSVSFDVMQKLETVTTNNICYYIDNEKTDKSIFFTAHYDHLGQFGPVTYNGANDNASGVALMLTLAEYFQKHKDEIPINLYFIAFTGEELGMLGSKAFVNNHLYMNCDGCDFVINLDLVGTGDDGICVVNGKVFDKEMSLIQKINDENNYFKHIQVRGEACNSDHCPFYMKNIPSIYIYTKGGTQAYHDINDNADQLPLTKFNELFNLLVKFVENYK